MPTPQKEHVVKKAYDEIEYHLKDQELDDNQRTKKIIHVLNGVYGQGYTDHKRFPEESP